MQFQSLARRTLAAGAVGAVAVGTALVAAPAAQAAPATSSYSCGIPNLAGPYSVSVISDVPGLPTTAGAGTDVPAGWFDVTNKVVVPKEAYQLLAGLGYTSAALPDFALALGDAAAGATGLSVPLTSFVASADGLTYSADVNGKNAAFEAPAAGTAALTSPASFTIRAAKADGSTADIGCTLAAGTTAGTITQVTTTKNKATATATAKSEVAAGKDVKVKVALSADNQVPTGKVKATIDGSKVGKGTVNKKGKVTITVKAKKLSAGKNKIKVEYAGDGYSSKAKGKVVVKVTG